MKTMSIPPLPVLLISAILLLSGCATHVSVDYDKSFEFSRLQSYVLLPKSEASTEDKRLSSPLIDQRIIKAINDAMTAKGYYRSEGEEDMKLVYQLDLKQEIASDGSGVTMVLGTGGRVGFGMVYNLPGGDVRTYDRGRLTIDILSADGKKLLWRGASSRRIHEAGTPEDNDRLINEIVWEILDKFPPM